MPHKLKWLNCFPNEGLQYWRRPCSQSWELGEGDLHLQGPSGLSCGCRALFLMGVSLGGICDFAQKNIYFGYFLSKINWSGKLLVISQNEI